jgi:carboxylesterase type B
MTRARSIVIFLLLLSAASCRFSASESTPAPGSPTQTFPAPTADSLLTIVSYTTVQGIAPDLLSLDIHAPANAQNAPVVMWIHSGAYINGDKANRMTDKISLFNAQGWILVSVNYHLGRPAPILAAG